MVGRQTRIVLAMVLAVWAGVAGATDYYVDAAGGADSADGLSTKTAWKTLAKVNGSTFKPGDSILLMRGGLWRETLEVPSSGAPDKPITIGAYGQGEKPILCGANVIGPWQREAAGKNVWSVVLAKVAPPQEDGDGSALDGRGEVSVWFDGVRGKRAESLQALGPQANWYYDGYKLYVYSTDDPYKAFTKPGIELPVRLEGIRLDSRPYAKRDRRWVVIQDLHLCKIRRWAIDAINSDHATVRGCLIEWVGPGNKWKDYYNDAVAVGLNHNTSNALVEDCDLHDCGCGAYIGTAQPGYAAKANSVRNCRILQRDHRHQRQGARHRRDLRGQHHLQRPDPGHPQRGRRAGRQPHRAELRPPLQAGGHRARDRNTVAYNVIASCQAAAVIVISDTGETEDHINGGDNNVIVNNVLFDTPLNSGLSFANPAGTDIRGNVVKNNIFCGIFLPIRFSGGIPADGAGNTIDFNCYWNADPKSAYARQPGQMALADWQGKLGWDKHSVFADPKFTASAPKEAKDFAVQPGSPCIDAGTDAGLKTDFAGGKVPQGKAPDIGAFEAAAE